MKLQIRSDWQPLLSPVVDRLVAEGVASRIFENDSALWGQDAQPEAAKRLGWTSAHLTAHKILADVEALREMWLANGVKRIVLCGMGGSSLAPEVMAKRFELPLTVLDATSPDQVAASLSNPSEISVVVSSKSGSTVETDSHRRLAIEIFNDAGIRPQDRMLIITDPESPLDSWARNEGFSVVNADPLVGGRYSALTAFGLAPVRLAGGNLADLIANTSAAADELRVDSTDNPAFWLAAALAAVPPAAQGSPHRDKLLVSAVDLMGLPDWIEQLVAESTGKQGRGTLPIAAKSSDPDYSRELPDALRILVSESTTASPLEGVGDVQVIAPLGSQFLLWEVATAVLGYLLGINPFDQPDVESAKQAARQALENPAEEMEPDAVDRGCSIRALGLERAGTIAAALDHLAAALPDDGYLAILAFASRPEHPRLESLRSALAERFSRPVSFGWGPRYLHSTGQYHKGGPAQGGFLQIRIRSDFDIKVPGQSFSFGDLLQAQADGDAQVLAERGRPVLILEFENSNAAVSALLDYCKEGRG